MEPNLLSWEENSDQDSLMLSQVIKVQETHPPEKYIVLKLENSNRDTYDPELVSQITSFEFASEKHQKLTVKKIKRPKPRRRPGSNKSRKGCLQRIRYVVIFCVILVIVFLTIICCVCAFVYASSNSESIDAEESFEFYENAQYLYADKDMQGKMYESLEAVIHKGLPGFRETVPNCSRLAKDALYPNESDYVKEARQWRFDERNFKQWLFDSKSKDKCQAIREKFAFSTSPLSVEESEYPLGYGLLVYKNSMQVYLLMSAIYHPQNAYCIAVDSKASADFKRYMKQLSKCFPNIFVKTTVKVKWCGFSVVEGVFDCLKYLSKLNHKWRYFQYLSGADLPLKTNLEMVRIFKRLNGTVNAEVTLFDKKRLRSMERMTPPLPLWKSSLSALLPRETVDAMFHSKKVRKLLNYLKETYCADETLWATIAGNRDVHPIPGAFDAFAVFAKIQKEKRQLNNLANSTNIVERTLEEPFPLDDYYISRYQVWAPSQRCAGKYVTGSCVYGVGDLDNLLNRPELIVHKFYLDFEPAAYFCVYNTVRRRALDDKTQKRFRGALYSKLPQVRMAEGESLEQINFFFAN